MRETVSVLVKNEFGVLARVVDLFSTRGFNIDSLNVAETLDPAVSRMTIVVSGEEKTLEQVRKQLGKLVDTLHVSDFSKRPHLEQELLLIKLSTRKRQLAELLALAQAFHAEVVDVAEDSLTLRLADSPERINAFLAAAVSVGVMEIARSGPVALGR